MAYVMLAGMKHRMSESDFYSNQKVLKNGVIAGISPMAFTVGLFVGLNFEETSLPPYRTRYCFHTFKEALEALEEWDGTGDPPRNWIKQKPEDRNNPNYKEDLNG